MTEIPEHLLKRSQAARSKSSGESAPADSAGAATPATVESTAPAAKAATPAPAPAAPPPPEPDLPVVTAYKQRKKIPVWAMATLSLLPIWLFMYVRSVTPTEVQAEGPVGMGAELYNACASCHGANGEGGAGRVLNDNEVWLTFPRIEDALNWIYHGTEGYEAAGVSGYGDPNREGGQHATRSYNGGAMPAQGGAITDYGILAVTCYIRYSINEVEEGPEFERWCAENSEVFAELEAGSLTLGDIAEVGPEPRPPLEDQTPGAVSEG